MRFHKLYKFTVIILLFLTSCGIGDLDFEQIEDYSTTRVFKLALAQFTVDQNDFLDLTGAEITIPIGEEAGFLFFINNPSLRSNLQKIEFEIEINNQFNREFKGKIQFLNNNNQETHVFDDINIKANDAAHKQTLTLIIANNTKFLNSTKVNFEVQLEPSSNGSVLDPGIQRTLNFRSTGVYYLTGKFND
ncbi:MAG: hypothetical protein ACPGUU_02545 [Flavobacteriaceae bacterium]